MFGNQIEIDLVIRLKLIFFCDLVIPCGVSTFLLLPLPLRLLMPPIIAPQLVEL